MGERTTSNEIVAAPGVSDGDLADEIMRAIRRILRAAAEHSRQLARDGDLSVSGLLCLRCIAEAPRGEPVTAAEVAAAVQLSNPTVSRILDRLESEGLVLRQRSTADRRKVFLQLTAQGRRRVKRLPQPLHTQFLTRLETLSGAQRRRLLTALRQVVELMGAADLDAAPMLTPESDVRGEGPRR